MNILTEEDVINALRGVYDPELHRDLVSLGMIKDISINDNNISFMVELTTPACPLKDKIASDCEKALKAIGAEHVNIVWGSQVRRSVYGSSSSGSNNSTGSTSLPHVKNVILVASGKGGVGKSTVAANLAIALAQDGAKVGLLDADIYGPSVPIMFGVEDRPTSPDGDKINPVHAHGIDLMSIGFFVSPEQAMVWRGPILHTTITQFINDVIWDYQDYLIVDLPPGTGDVQLSIAQQLQVTGAILVTTPQLIALADVIRGKTMFDQVRIPTLGIVENMSYFECPNCSTSHEIFSGGGGEKAAEQLKIPFLGRLPLVPSVRQAGDDGVPIVAKEPNSPVSQAFKQVARSLAGKISIQTMGATTGKKRIFEKIFTS